VGTAPITFKRLDRLFRNTTKELQSLLVAREVVLKLDQAQDFRQLDSSDLRNPAFVPPILFGIPSMFIDSIDGPY
jgi:hypothetical protein